MAVEGHSQVQNGQWAGCGTVLPRECLVGVMMSQPWTPGLTLFRDVTHTLFVIGQKQTPPGGKTDPRDSKAKTGKYRCILL